MSQNKDRNIALTFIASFITNIQLEFKCSISEASLNHKNVEFLYHSITSYRNKKVERQIDFNRTTI